MLIEPLGRPFLEAIAIAKERGALLWEDEHAAGVLAEQQFGIHRVWTQVVVGVFCDLHGLPPEVWQELTGKLLQLRIGFTSIHLSTIPFSGKKSGWDPWKQPLTAIIDYLATPQLNFEDRVFCWATLMLSVWGTASVAQARQVTQESLRRLALLPAGRAMIEGCKSVAYYVVDNPEDATRLWIVIYEWLESNQEDGMIWH